MENVGENEEKRKGKEENEKCKGKKAPKNTEDFFPACHFRKPLKVFLGLPNWKFLPGK